MNEYILELFPDKKDEHYYNFSLPMIPNKRQIYSKISSFCYCCSDNTNFDLYICNKYYGSSINGILTLNKPSGEFLSIPGRDAYHLFIAGMNCIDGIPLENYDTIRIYSLNVLKYIKIECRTMTKYDNSKLWSINIDNPINKIIKLQRWIKKCIKYRTNITIDKNIYSL